MKKLIMAGFLIATGCVSNQESRKDPTQPGRIFEKETIKIVTQAGGVSIGNGGQAVVCKDAVTGKVTTEAFDLFESRVLFETEYKFAEDEDPLTIALELAKKLDEGQGGNEGSQDSIQGKVMYVAAKMHPINKKARLKLTEDSKEFVFPSDCEIVQTINFRNNMKIWYDSNVWEALSNVDKAALYLHEAVYWHLRDAGVEKDSRRTRKIVSYMMSGGELSTRFGLPTEWLSKMQYCHSKEFNPTLDWNTKFVAYKDPLDRMVVQFLQIDGYRVLTRTTIMGETDQSLSELPIQKDNSNPTSLTGWVKSPTDDETHIFLIWGQGSVLLRGEIEEGTPIEDDLECVDWDMSW
jgi:hypothetical protein